MRDKYFKFIPIRRDERKYLPVMRITPTEPATPRLRQEYRDTYAIGFTARLAGDEYED